MLVTIASLTTLIALRSDSTWLTGIDDDAFGVATDATVGQALAIDIPPYTSPPRAEISEDEAKIAQAINASTPANAGEIVPARPFQLAQQTAPVDRLRAQQCLATAVYYEAASEDISGQRAVAQVVLNRVRHTIYPRTICDVVLQGSSRITGCQFTFTCDGSLARPARGASWIRAQIVAQDALNGYVESSVGTATHYHADWVAPWWRSSLTKLATIGGHIFYRWKGSAGSRDAFVQRYAGVEPDPSKFLAVAEVPSATSLTAAEPDAGSGGDASPTEGLPNVQRSEVLRADADRVSLDADNHGTLAAGERDGKITNQPR